MDQTEQTWREVAGSQAVELEQQFLSIGRAFLPQCAIGVLDGGEPTAEYWQWLCSQVEVS